MSHPITARIDYVRRCIFDGKHVFMTCGNGRDGNTAKFKIHIMEAPNACSPVCGACLLHVLDFIVECLPSHVVTDRGHKFSSGISEICIWVRLCQAGTTGSGSASGGDGSSGAGDGDGDDGDSGDAPPPQAGASEKSLTIA